MSFYTQKTQYQVHTEPTFVESEIGKLEAWHRPFSEPVRVTINKQLAVALIVSGLTFTFPPTFPEIVTESRWHQPLSEPVRIKPRLHAALNPYYFAEPFSLTGGETTIEAKWHYAWSEPIRLSFKRSINTAAQRAYFAPDRLLPNPNNFATLHGTEINNDIFDAAVNVYNPVPTPNIPVTTSVGIVERAIGGNPVSIDET